MTTPVYLDNQATTRVDPRVIDAMIPLMDRDYGNAASIQHEFGWRAEAAVEQARARVGALVGALPGEIVFTSGATESINIALKGAALGSRSRAARIITAVTEHRAVLDTCLRLEEAGFEVVRLPVDGEGMVDPDDVRRALTPGTILVSIMAANNEIGTIAPVAAIAAICREQGVIFHTDATQAAGKIPLDMQAMGIDLLSFSAHKMHGPKGVGALALSARTPPLRLAPILDGGGHEQGLRPGTLNVPAIAGFGVAADIARVSMAEEGARAGRLRDLLVGGITGSVEGARLNGHPTARIPQNANICFPGARADAIMMAMKDVAVSAGSACSSASPEPSHVLLALGLSREETLSSLRLGLSRFTTEEEIEYAVRRVAETVTQLAAREAMFH
ncbi:MAG TPA: cysteine desulfurase family protein [Bacteroidota bacterium]|nr:cysteine desulfurase family protein [Bacteroidota bacterium]